MGDEVKIILSEDSMIQPVRLSASFFIYLLAATILFAISRAPALAKSDECGTPPAAAVTALPAPLSDWGTLDCTPFGYVITAKDGWIWAEPMTAEPVFVPAQMVRSDPAPLGSSAYFKKIELSEAHGPEFEAASEAAFGDMDGPKKFNGYRLDLSSYADRSMRLYFFEDGRSRWGIWCPHDKCDRSSRFMVMDMAKPAR
jgi:hypothetical protein